MTLSNNLIDEFAKLVTEPKEEVNTVYNGEFRLINGKKYVRIDGSEVWTPIQSTVDAKDGDRVIVNIKDHIATLTGNLTDPAARTTVLNNLSNEVDEFGNSVRMLDNTVTMQENSITAINNHLSMSDSVINAHEVAINAHDTYIQTINSELDVQDSRIQAVDSTIKTQGDTINSINNSITAQENIITALGNTVEAQNNRITANSNNILLQGNTITQQGNIINEQNSKITILNSAFVIDDGVITGLTGAIIDNIKTDYLDAAYADIDFTNINIAAISTLFSESGIIKDLVVQQGSITGELVGVTIKGDLIEANSLKADKLVVRGEDGLYYKLNIDGMNNISTQEAAKFVVTSEEPSDWETNYKDYYVVTNNEYVHLTNQTAPTWQANTYYKLKPVYQSGLDGTNIVANSITADKIQVTDLVAFGATIGGFVIGNASIHTPTKTSIDSDLNGIYLGQDGQIYIGDINNRIKYYKDSNDQWKLDIKADEIRMGSSNKTIQQEINEVREDATTAYNKAVNADKFVISDTQPGTSDQDKLWYDTTTQKIKKWIPANPDDPSSIAKWIVVNDYSGEISAVLEVANTAASAAGQIDQKISEANSNLSSEITGQYEAYVSSEIAKYDEDVQINIIKQIKANDTIANVVSNFSFEEDGLYIGKSNSQYKLQAANDRINMLYYDENNNKQIISYWNRDVFNSSKIETNEFSIPPFKWFLRSNGSLSLRKE